MSAFQRDFEGALRRHVMHQLSLGGRKSRLDHPVANLLRRWIPYEVCPERCGEEVVYPPLVEARVRVERCREEGAARWQDPPTFPNELAFVAEMVKRVDAEDAIEGRRPIRQVLGGRADQKGARTRLAREP